jgi:hypothetical protein
MRAFDLAFLLSRRLHGRESGTRAVLFVERSLRVDSCEASDPTPEQAALKPALLDVPRKD